MPPTARSSSSSHTSCGGGIRLAGRLTVAKCQNASSASGKTIASSRGRPPSPRLRRTGSRGIAAGSRATVSCSVSDASVLTTSRRLHRIDETGVDEGCEIGDTLDLLHRQHALGVDLGFLDLLWSQPPVQFHVRHGSLQRLLLLSEL